MEIIVTILAMILVGGFIGGFTNSLAIKMLFRPYEARYIGRWKIPFTPGVIPKRRAQLARQLGMLVVRYLVTADSIQDKLQDPSLKKAVITKLESELSNFSGSSLTVRELAQRYDIQINTKQIKSKLAEKILNNVWQTIEEKKYMPLEHLLEDLVSEKDMAKAAEFIRDKAIIIVNNEETRGKLTAIIHHYLQSKGFIANMVLSMFSTNELAAKIQRLITDYLRSEDGYHWLNQHVIKEWEGIKKIEVNDILSILEKKDISSRLQNIIEDRIELDKWLDTSAGSLLQPFLPQVKKKILPAITEQIFIKLSESIPNLLKQLEVEKMVENQVASFPTSRIEELVLSIINKEFKLIVYLGVLLGGLIGLIQAIIFILV